MKMKLQIVDATPEEARLLRLTGSSRAGVAPESRAMLNLRCGKAFRIVGHDHTPVHATCRIARNLHALAWHHGRKLKVRHDGADLLVARVK